MRVHSSFALTVALSTSLFLLSPANATMMNVDVTGVVNGKNIGFSSNNSVQVGDKFGFSLSYDDSLQVTSIVPDLGNGGAFYTVITQSFNPAMTSWWGTLPNEIVQYNTLTANGALGGWGSEQTWYKGTTTNIVQSSWQITAGVYSSNPTQRGFDLQFGTLSGSTSGGGGWATGSPSTGGLASNAIDAGGITISSIIVTAVSPVPEPSEWLLMICGLGLIGFIATNRNKQRAEAKLIWA